MSRKVDMISDRQFSHLASDMTDHARVEAWVLWKEDLTTKMDKDQLIVGANSILYYFGSKVLITDVDWDEAGNCFLWEVDQPC